MRKFSKQIASLFDRERLVSELHYEGEYFAEINQEKDFFEIVFYHGEGLSCIKFPLTEFHDFLEFAKIDLAGDLYNKTLRLRSDFLEEVKMGYVNECKTVILPPSCERKNEHVKILHNRELIAEVIQEEKLMEVIFYYYNKNIELPIESLQHVLKEAKKMLVNGIK